MLLGVFSQLLSNLSFGISNVLWKIPLKSYTQFQVIFYRTLISTFLLALIFVWFGNPSEDYANIGLAILLSSISFLGLFFFTKALQLGKASVVSVVTAASFIVGELTSVLILGESIHSFHVISILLFVISILGIQKIEWKFFGQLKTLMFALLAAIIWGITLTLMSLPSKSIGFFETSLLTEISVLVISGLLLSFYSKSDKKVKLNIGNKSISTIALMSILSVIGLSSMYFAFSKLDTYIVVGISSTTHLISVVASKFILKESITKRVFISSLLSLIAIIIFTLE